MGGGVGVDWLGVALFPAPGKSIIVSDCVCCSLQNRANHDAGSVPPVGAFPGAPSGLLPADGPRDGLPDALLHALSRLPPPGAGARGGRGERRPRSEAGVQEPVGEISLARDGDGHH